MNYLLDTTDMELLNQIDPAAWFDTDVYGVTPNGNGHYVAKTHSNTDGDIYADKIDFNSAMISIDKRALIRDVVHVTSGVFYVIYAINENSIIDIVYD